MNIQTPTAPTQRPPVGERVQLGRYSIGTGERLIIGQRVDGVVRVSDCPAEGHGRAYLIERELEHDGNSALQALIADYLDQAHRLAEIPMATSLLKSDLFHLMRGRSLPYVRPSILP